MKRSKLISSSVAVLLAMALLAGGGGITFIRHTCQMCDISTATTVSLINPFPEEDVCCSGPMDDHQGDKSLSESCCNYKIEQFNLSNYVASSQLIPDAVTEHHFSSPLMIVFAVTEQVARPVNTLNKHGGRFIVNINCQILS